MVIPAETLSYVAAYADTHATLLARAGVLADAAVDMLDPYLTTVEGCAAALAAVPDGPLADRVRLRRVAALDAAERAAEAAGGG